MNIKDITPDFLWENGINPDGMRFGPNFYPYNPKLKQFSRELRNHGQMSEALLWKCLKGKKTGYLFLRQRPILNYIADFFCYELKLVIEIDGASHFSEEAQKRDAERDRQMQAIGLTIIRVLDSDVRKNPEDVTRGIMEQFPRKEEQLVFRIPPTPFTKGEAYRTRAYRTWRKAATQSATSLSSIATSKEKA